MGNVELKSQAHSLVDDVVCQGVRYLFELSAFEGGCHATALVRSGRACDPVLGGFYPSMDRMLAQAPADLCRQGVPPAVVAYVQESLIIFTAYR